MKGIQITRRRHTYRKNIYMEGIYIMRRDIYGERYKYREDIDINEIYTRRRYAHGGGKQTEEIYVRKKCIYKGDICMD